MKRPIAMMAVLSAAAMMSAMTPSLFTADRAVNAFAGTAGWTEEDGSWRYKDSDGYYLTDTWKKKDGVMHYLDEDGEIAVDTMINDEYYVNADGKMMTNHWLSVYNEEEMDAPDAPEFFWYYFGKDGRAVRSKWHNIEDSWYYFNADGHMTTGRQNIDGATYYLGAEDDGTMKTGWISFEEESDDPENTSFWYYFDKNGRMVENQIDRKIDGNYYTFQDGRMQTGWFRLPEEAAADAGQATPSNAGSDNASTEAAGTEAGAAGKADSAEGTIHGYQYYEADGKRASGWYEIEGAEGISQEGEVHRFFFRSGKPLAAESGIQVFTVDSKKYAFNTRGEMQTGKQVITLEDGQIANAYFGTDGVMKTGKQNIYNEDLGENQTWFFYTDGTRKGQGFHGIRDNSIFFYGLRQDAASDLRFAPVEYNGASYLVNAAGSIQKAASSSKSTAKPELGNGYKDVKDANGKVWTVDANGIIQ
ncbi:MAG: cell wall-binding protein [Lachnospiraceae bacterium]|nr:cell wall-binding protein [Lachnospiraceae bacterium]